MTKQDLSNVLWSEMTKKQQAQYRSEYANSYAVETGCTKKQGFLIFDCRFDCCPRDESIIERRAQKAEWKKEQQQREVEQRPQPVEALYRQAETATFAPCPTDDDEIDCPF